ncbi:MAG TPA: M64 family metallopeptidase, partial [Thermoanaerobaculia bacterium]|nr:M64 family metallopeptidase [Thermoanaerobaculia bacterium]
ATEEVFSADRVVREPLPWPGNPRRPLDDTNLGKYFFEVIDRTSNRVVYSRGFSSVYGEWETTGEAKTVRRTFSESLRFPEPSGPVQVVVKKRDAANAFREVWSFVLDPKDKSIDASLPPSPGPVIEIQKSGESPEKVDFLILGDGYTAAERPKFEKDARRLAELLFAVSPFKERRGDFNVWALCPPSEEPGISRPSTGVHRRSRVGATYDAFGSERYVLTFENRSFRDVASFAPYEFVEILTNTRTYGGGGIFGQFSTVAADSLWAPYVFVHEFGHHFAGLADEYFTSAVAYGPAPAERVEPWEPNATALLDPGNLKWKDLVTPGTPVPTPWKQAEFEKASLEAQEKRRKIRAENRPEDEMDALFREEQVFETRLLGTDAHSGRVGAFEGALYEARGYYRPQEDCIMFTRDQVPFCAVCRRAISVVVDLYTR